jgi:Family of unknown function (DUF6152)
MKRVLAIAAIVLCGASMPAAAHHTLAGYIQTRADVLIGKVKEFQWTNPHTWLTVLVNDRGTMVEWTFEGVSTARLTEAGFKKDTMMPGDSVSVIYNPRRDGKPGGMFFAVTLADGRSLKLDRYQRLKSGGTRIE